LLQLFLTSCAYEKQLDSYLDIAEHVLNRYPEPLTAKQILKHAKEMKIVPTHLHGKTQHKTLQARLSEDILLRRWRSAFMRTDPGRFVLRNSIDNSVNKNIRIEEFPAPRRSDQLRQFNVLCFRSEHFKLDHDLQLVGQSKSLDFLKHCETAYRKLADVWKSVDYSFARIFVVLMRDKKMAVFNSDRSKSVADGRNSAKSIGLTGYVKEEDANLFASDAFGITEAIQRTVIEQFHMILPSNRLVDLATISIKGILRAPEPLNENSLMVVASLECPLEFDLVRQLGNMRTAEWLLATDRRNDLSEFEAISQSVFSSGMLNALGQNEETNCSSNSLRRRADHSIASCQPK
jgi:HB1, ASXL, restriction endonuclease HTH domain